MVNCMFSHCSASASKLCKQDNGKCCKWHCNESSSNGIICPTHGTNHTREAKQRCPNYNLCGKYIAKSCDRTVKLCRGCCRADMNVVRCKVHNVVPITIPMSWNDAQESSSNDIINLDFSEDEYHPSSDDENQVQRPINNFFIFNNQQQQQEQSEEDFNKMIELAFQNSIKTKQQEDEKRKNIRVKELSKYKIGKSTKTTPKKLEIKPNNSVVDQLMSKDHDKSAVDEINKSNINLLKKVQKLEEELKKTEGKLEEKEQELEDHKCKVCYENKVDVTLSGCGHCFCSGCFNRILELGDNKCPQCRKKINRLNKSKKIFI